VCVRVCVCVCVCVCVSSPGAVHPGFEALVHRIVELDLAHGVCSDARRPADQSTQTGEHHRLDSITDWRASQTGQHHRQDSITDWRASLTGEHHRLESTTDWRAPHVSVCEL